MPGTSKTLIPSIIEIRQKTIQLLGYRSCLWQIRVVEASLKHDKDIISITVTGSGKTLTFWMPLLFRPDGPQIIITPLNTLGKQNVETLTALGISAIALHAETATAKNFRVRISYYILIVCSFILDGAQDIEEFKYRVVVTNIETFRKEGGGLDRLWKNPNFIKRIISIVWDEGQCVSQWADI